MLYFRDDMFQVLEHSDGILRSTLPDFMQSMAILVKRQVRGNPQARLIVSTVHLLAPRNDSDHLRHLANFSNGQGWYGQVLARIAKFRNGNDDILIMMGDLNCPPHRLKFQYLLNGSVDKSAIEELKSLADFQH